MIEALALGLPTGFMAGTLVTLVARVLPERGRLVGRPICADQGCGLDWAAVSPTLRARGSTHLSHLRGRPAPGDVALELGTAAVVGALAAALVARPDAVGAPRLRDPPDDDPGNRPAHAAGLPDPWLWRRRGRAAAFSPLSVSGGLRERP